MGSGLRPSHLQGTSGNRDHQQWCSHHLCFPSWDPRDRGCPSSPSQRRFLKRPPAKKYRKTQIKSNPRGKGKAESCCAQRSFGLAQPTKQGWLFLGRSSGGEFQLPGYQQGKEPPTPLFLPQFLTAPTAPNGGERSGRGTGLWQETGHKAGRWLQCPAESAGLSLRAPRGQRGLVLSLQDQEEKSHFRQLSRAFCAGSAPSAPGHSRSVELDHPHRRTMFICPLGLWGGLGTSVSPNRDNHIGSEPAELLRGYPCV